MTDIDDYLIPDLAVRTLREWLASPKFKVKATVKEVQAETDLGRKYLGANSYDQQAFAELRDTWNQVFRWWRSRGWVTYSETAFGPQSFGTDDPRLERLALVMDRRGCRSDGRPFSEATERWIGSVTGSSCKKRFCRITTNYEPLVEFLAAEFGPDIDGQTREQISAQLQLPVKLTNSIVSSLITSGSHRQHRPRLEDGGRPKQIVKT